MRSVPPTLPTIIAGFLAMVHGPERTQPDSTPRDRVQRRLAAILFADVVGYSRLTAHDEVGTWHRLQSVVRDVVRPTIQAHAGRIVSIAGDGILVTFASAVDAVSSAIAL